MKIAVIGLWHLGCVVTACLAEAGYEVIAYDPNKEIIKNLQQGHPPIFEPDLKELMAKNHNANTLCFVSFPEKISEAEIVWITFDTPVDDCDHADVEFVINHVKKIVPFLRNNTVLLLSSQVPVGTTRELERFCQDQYPTKNLRFAFNPENLRLGNAIHAFTHPHRTIIGIRSQKDRAIIQQLFQPFSQNIVWMSIESAEMTKHALNTFLAISVIFMNEIATLCEHIGADAREVEQGLKTEERIGLKAYLRPGSAIAGGTLMRDVNYLSQISEQYLSSSTLFSGLIASNEFHKQWSQRSLLKVLKDLRSKRISLIGLAYKEGTDTLRRSTAVEIGLWLKQQGADVCAFDPKISCLPANLENFIDLKSTLQEVLYESEAVIVTTWSELTKITSQVWLSYVKTPYVFDANGFLWDQLGNDSRIHYYMVGTSCN